ncbi:MAG: glutamate formimidoyltransferase [Bacteroidetes bacterium]|nr:glutamate formimidoyltransferase [Bacteroidota bacterium]
MQKRLIECVPNFSEGCDLHIIKQITDAIETVEGVRLLDTDPGKATNRTVVTFVGEPEAVIDAAYLAIEKAAHLIDMRNHKGEHPRMGATDVCPLIPVSGISMEETAAYAQKLARRVGENLHIPVYLYEYAQPDKKRSNLSVIRAGEYEGFADKMLLPEWKPDFGPATFNAQAGATVIGARDFLIAYNVNLNTKSTRIANRIAFDVREAGRVVREGNPYTGKIKTDETGEPLRIPGKLKNVKAIGWYIEEYQMAQISINLTNYKETPLHTVFEECRKSADERGARVTGSELVGLVPLEPMLQAGRYFLEKQGLSVGVSESELIWTAVKSMGLDELGPFDPAKKIIEYLLRDAGQERLVSMTVKEFANETAADSPAPGGGSVAAAVGAFGVALGTMVANLSAGKRGWESRTAEFSPWAEKGQHIKDQLLALVDEDTRAFNRIMEAFGLPKETDHQKTERKAAIQQASKYATEVPFRTLEVAASAIPLLKEMAEKGNPNSLSDAGVGIACLLTAMQGAWMNVLINAQGLDDKNWATDITNRAEKMISESKTICNLALSEVESRLKG